MRGKMLIILVVMCLLLIAAQVLFQQEKTLERQRLELENELLQLQAENARLWAKVTELREQQSRLGQRMQDWLDAWEVDVAETTAYAPLDPGAKESMCYMGDSAVTASGAKVVPGITAAAAPDVPFGTRVYIPGRGMRIVQDRGPAINYTGDGVMQLDLCVETREEALDEIGRQKILVAIKNEI